MTRRLLVLAALSLAAAASPAQASPGIGIGSQTCDSRGDALVHFALTGLTPGATYSIYLVNSTVGGLDPIGTVTANASGSATFSTAVYPTWVPPVTFTVAVGAPSMSDLSGAIAQVAFGSGSLPSCTCQAVTGNSAVDNAVCVQNNVYVDSDGDSTHGAYVSAVAAAVSSLRTLGQITKSQSGAIVSAAARSSVDSP